MTYLELCQMVNELAGMQGSFYSAKNATGYQKTIAQLVANAWVDLQNLRSNFNFLRNYVTFATVPGQAEYQIADIFGTSVSPVQNWVEGMVLYDNTPLREYLYDDYLLHDVGSWSPSAPSSYAVNPVDRHLHINPPDNIYSITAHYFAKPEILTEDTDVPSAPPEFHYAIAYRAVVDFANFLGNSDLYQLYTQKANSVIGSFLRSQNPAKRIRTRSIA